MILGPFSRQETPLHASHPWMETALLQPRVQSEQLQQFHQRGPGILGLRDGEQPLQVLLQLPVRVGEDVERATHVPTIRTKGWADNHGAPAPPHYSPSGAPASLPNGHLTT